MFSVCKNKVRKKIEANILLLIVHNLFNGTIPVNGRELLCQDKVVQMASHSSGCESHYHQRPGGLMSCRPCQGWHVFLQIPIAIGTGRWMNVSCHDKVVQMAWSR